MGGDEQLFHLNKKWDISLLGDDEVRRYPDINTTNTLLLHHKGDYGNEGENDEEDGGEEARDRAEVELKFAEINNGLHNWIGNKIILIVNPI